MRLGYCSLLCLAATVAYAQPLPPVVTVGRIASPPVVDGNLDDSCWSPAAAGGLPQLLEFRTGAAVQAATTAWLGYDDRNLYVAVRCQEPNLPGLRAERCVRVVPGVVGRDGRR